MTPLGSQTICGHRLPWSRLTHLSVHMGRPHLNRTPQVHYAVHVFILALFPAQTVPHSKFSNLIHPSTISSESIAPRSLCKRRPPPAASGEPHNAQRTGDPHLVTQQPGSYPEIAVLDCHLHASRCLSCLVFLIAQSQN